MEPPEGLDPDEDKDTVWQLHKAVQGTKQGAACWNSKITDVLATAGFKRALQDEAVYLGDVPRFHAAIISLHMHVDDGLVAHNSSTRWQQTLDTMRQHFGVSIRLLAPPRVGPSGVLGGNPPLVPSGRDASRPVDSPSAAPPAAGTPPSPEASRPFDSTTYRSALGRLKYLANACLPDIAYICSQPSRLSLLNQLQVSPSHWNAVKRVLRYLRGTTFSPPPATRWISVVSPTATGRAVGKTKDLTGYLLFAAGAPISWSSTRHKCVSQSTMEAEFIAIAASALAKQTHPVRLLRILRDLHRDESIRLPTPLFIDKWNFVTSERKLTCVSTMRETLSLHKVAGPEHFSSLRDCIDILVH